MADNNLRIVYNNVTDLNSTTIIGSTGSVGATNLKLDTKSKIWMSGTASTTAVSVKMVVTMASTNINAIILPFTNFTTSANIRVRGYTGSEPTLGGTVDTPTATTPGTLVFDSGTKTACPYPNYDLWTISTPLGVNTYSYGGGKYARCYINDNEFIGSVVAPCTSLLIEITDTNSNQYLEISRLILGEYWSPKYNTSFGMQAKPNDLTTNIRTDSGDSVSNRGISYNTVSFDLKYMDSADRDKFWQIVKVNGRYRPLFISLFPESSDYGKESIYQVYGKLSDPTGIAHSVYQIYASQVDIEEI